MNRQLPLRHATPAGPAAIPSPSAEAVEINDAFLSKTKLAFASLLAFTVILYGRPEDYFPVLNSGFHLALIVSVLAGGMYLLALTFSHLRIVWTTQLKIMLALTIWYGMGIPFAYWISHSIESYTQYWLKTLFVFFLITQLSLSVDRVKKTFWAIIFCEFIVAVLSLTLRRADLVAADDRLNGVTVGFLSGNYLGIAVGMTFPFIINFLIRKKSFLKTIFLLATMGLVAWMLVLTASRSGFMTLLVSLILTWFFILKERASGQLLAFILLGSLLAAIPFAPKIFWSRLGTLWSDDSNAAARSAEESSELRSQALHNSILFTMEHPVFGLGIGNFPIANGEATHNAMSWIGTHNMYTQVSSEGGLPALLLFLAMLWVSVRDMWRLSKRPVRSPADEEARSYARATLAGTLSFIFGGFFAHVATDYYLYYLIGASCSLYVIGLRDAALQAEPSSSLKAPLGHAYTHS